MNCAKYLAAKNLIAAKLQELVLLFHSVQVRVFWAATCKQELDKLQCNQKNVKTAKL